MTRPAVSSERADQVRRALCDRRRELDLTQEQLAARAGTTQSAISDFENGRAEPRLSTLERLAEALEMELTVDLRVRCPR